MKDRSRLPMILCLAPLTVLGLIAAACGSSSDASQATSPSSLESTGPDSTNTASIGSESTSTSVPDATSTSTSTPTPSTTSATAPPNTLFEGPGPYRVAPAGPDPFVLRWNSTSVWAAGHHGEWNKVADGRFAEVAHVGYGDLVFQQVEREPVIWLLTESGPQELLVAAEGQELTLEGAGVNANGEPIIYYQRHDMGGTPETSRSSLRTYNYETGEVTEIIETGGWELGASFNHLSQESTAVAVSWSEGSYGNTMVDLTASSQLMWEQASRVCSEGEPGCVWYEHATVVGGRSIGVRPIVDRRRNVIDQYGLFEFDLVLGTERLITAFPWEHGLWYVEDMFGFGSNSVMLSLSNRHNRLGSPLPALVVSIESGAAWTLPEAWFVRPAYLS